MTNTGSQSFYSQVCRVLIKGVAFSSSNPSLVGTNSQVAIGLTTFYFFYPRGRSADFYNKGYGAYLASTVARVRDACRDRNVLETSV